MGRPTSSSKKQSAPPPLSLTKCWDKGKWHFDAPSFPAHLPRKAGWTHIVAALRFLDQREQLTVGGRDELAHADDEIVLISEHIKVGSQAFLDQSYESYLQARGDYGSPPPVQVLEVGWANYTTNYDISKRPRANAYQLLLLGHSYDRTANTLLRALDHVHDLEARLRSALNCVPASERPLIEAALASREGDPISLAASWPDAAALLHALRYLDARRFALVRMRAALILAERLHSDPQSSYLPQLVYAVNLGATSESDAAWRALTGPERHRLSEAVNLLFVSGDDIHLALCAMRSVGNAQSLRLIDQSVGDRREGVTQYGDGREEPSWEPIRREAREAIVRREL